MVGLAFDVGTTTLAASVIDLRTGERLARRGALNPQRQFGADVISRMESACASPDMVRCLASLVRDELRRLAGELLEEAQAGPVSVAAFAGNPAMEHLLLGLPVDTLARIPYRPAFRESRWIGLADLGWDLPVLGYLFPLPGGFVGGDLVAFLHGEAAKAGNVRTTLYLDLGTNGEIALKVGDRYFCTSAAAGPAFEGGNLSCGMAALPGAITGAVIDGDKVSITTVGNMPPVGICGSGVIEAVAGLRRAGVLDATGRLLAPLEISSNLGCRIAEERGQSSFVLHRDARGAVSLTQDDVRQVQMAKAAVRAGIEVVAARAGFPVEGVEEVVVTGSFGARLNPRDLCTIGILAEGMEDRTRFVEEGALAGVERMLCDPAGAAAVDSLAKRCSVVPLSGNPLFEREFLTHMNFSDQ